MHTDNVVTEQNVNDNDMYALVEECKYSKMKGRVIRKINGHNNYTGKIKLIIEKAKDSW